MMFLSGMVECQSLLLWGQRTTAHSLFQMMASNGVLGNIKHPMKHLQQFWLHQLSPKGFLHLHRLSQAIEFHAALQGNKPRAQPNAHLQSCTLSLVTLKILFMDKKYAHQVKPRIYC